ncbi:MAG: MBL fold metallo-hydrolase [Candidatus Thorarchaeota archaeon]|jgi:L-ascorbate metabolism protein UlaG (beta-lactamase superfamily)
MGLTSKPRILMALGAILILVTVGSAIVALPLLTPPPPPAGQEDSITITLLDNAGVMIEADDLRIYIDPIDLNSSFEDLDADAILVTHPHGDHYQSDTIHMLQKEGTVNVFPANMTEQVSNHDGIGVVPGDSVQVGTINITAFYMYTFPVDIYPASHPRVANWTSYIIDIDGFTIFHAGDSKNIDEYEELAGQIDVALLPLGPGCQTMADFEIVLALETIDPGCFIPIHYAAGAVETWIAEYEDMVADRTDCNILSLDYFEFHTFEQTGQ